MQKPRANAPKRVSPQHYSREQKIIAVTALRMHGGLSEEGCAAARKMLNNLPVATSTLALWQIDLKDEVDAMLDQRRPEDSAVVRASYEAVLGRMQSIVAKIVVALDNAPMEIQNLNDARNIAVVLGILSDKIERAMGSYPEHSDQLRRLHIVCDMLNYNPVDTFNDWLDTLYEIARSPTPPSATIDLVNERSNR